MLPQQGAQIMENYSYTDPCHRNCNVGGAVQFNLESGPMKMGAIFYETVTSDSNTFLSQ
jgi:hypothetical protein